MVNIQRPTKIMGKPILNTDVPTDEQVLTFDSGDDNWQAEDGGGGAANTFVIGCNIFDIIADSTAEFSAPFSAQLLAIAEDQRQTVMPVACTAKNIVIEIDANTNADATVFTLRVNGADTALTVSVAAGTSGTFVFDADVSIAEEDLVSCEGDNSLNTGTIRWASWSVECQI